MSPSVKPVTVCTIFGFSIKVWRCIRVDGELYFSEGVGRDFQRVPAGYFQCPPVYETVDAAADQLRVLVLERAEDEAVQARLAFEEMEAVDGERQPAAA